MQTQVTFYETVAIIGKRANQISVEMKNDLSKKLQEFASYNDNLEEVFENREQIEISRYYEKLPKPTLIAAQEYEEGKVYFRNPAKEKRETTVIFHLGLCKRSLPQVTQIVLFLKHESFRVETVSI